MDPKMVLSITTEFQSHRRNASGSTTTSSSSHASPDLSQFGFASAEPSPYSTRTSHYSRSSSISSVLSSPDSAGGPGADRRCRSRASSAAGLPYTLHRTPSVDSLHSTDEESEWSSTASDFPSTANWSFPVDNYQAVPSPASRRPSDAGIAYGVQSMGLSDREQAKEDVLHSLADLITNAPTTSAGDKARASFVHAWLTHSYAVHQDGNVSRQAFFGSYMRVCDRFNVRGVNAASFGKAVRAAFPQVKTRRLGVRGNSKYHYCGIRPATQSEAVLLAELTNADNNTHSSPEATATSKVSPTAAGASPPRVPAAERPLNLPSQFPNSAELLSVDRRFAEEPFKKVWHEYSRYCSDMLDIAEAGQVEKFEGALHGYYGSPNWNPESRNIVEDSVVSSIMFRAESFTYDACLAALLSRGLDAMDANQFVVLRQLGEQIEQFFCDATQEFSQAFTSPKVELVARFGHLLTRVVGICQISQALKGPGFRGSGREEMLEAWETIDFESIRNHCALATNCHQEQLSHCFSEFSKVLQNDETFNCRTVAMYLDAMMQNFMGMDIHGERELSPRSLLVRASFVITQLMRDLTLRSHKSFGSFQLLALFCQDYIGFIVLRQVALPPSAVSASVQAVQPANFHAPQPQAPMPTFDMSMFGEEARPGNSLPPQAFDYAPLQHPSENHQQDFPIDFVSTSSMFAEPQYATFHDFSFPTGRSSTMMLTPLASNHHGGDLTAKGNEFQDSDWPSNLIPQTPLSPSFLLTSQ